MTARRYADATTAQLERLYRPLVAARLFPDQATLVAVHRTRPWAIQVNARGDVAVLDRWRDHLDLLAIEALWCPHRDLPAAVTDLHVCATDHGFSGLVSPPVLEADVPFYRAAGLTIREMLETLETTLGPSAQTAEPGMSMVRAASPTDISAILEVDAACFTPFWRYDRRLLERFCAAGGLAVAEHDGRCLGYTLVTVDRGTAVLGRLCVEPQSRRRGVGMHLLRSALERACAADARHVTLSTQGDNAAALSLYRAAGFRLTGRRYAFLTLGSDLKGGEGDRIDPFVGD
ncbi:MAG: GNAT family N-acetyltransferase [Coriobacteriia bacterium]|nr:GNAT family N-acetyltransferase [Coriobacteriia bacterium]